MESLDMTSTSRNKFILYSVIGVSLLAIAVRLIAIHMYDIQIDEITYAHFALTIDAGELPRNYGGGPFFLHPPGYYALLAVWRFLFFHGGSIFNELTILRGLNITLAGFSALLITLLTKLVTKRFKLGLLAGLLFAIDPFLIRQDTRGLMETMTMLLLFLGLWLLLKNSNTPDLAARKWFGVGLVFGLAIVTKDVAVPFLLIALVLMAFRKVGPGKRVLTIVIPAAIIPYAVWVAIVTRSGYLSDFITQNTAGLKRFIGLLQITGFNVAGAPSKSGTLISTIPHYASSYFIMCLGAASAVWLLTSKDTMRRRWGCIGTAGALVVAYLYLCGTFEEQYLYYLMAPSIISVIVGATELWDRVPVVKLPKLRKLFAVVFISLMTFSVVSYAINMTAPANGWQMAVSWIDSNVPNNSTICLYAQAQFLVQGHGYNICDYSTAAAMKAHNVQYVLVSQKLSNSNYAPLSKTQLADLAPNSHIVFHFASRDSGVFDILKLPTNIVPDTSQYANNAAAQQSHHSTVSTSVPATLANTGPSTDEIISLFAGSCIFGTFSAYLYFYFKTRRMDQISQDRQGYQYGALMPVQVFIPTPLTAQGHEEFTS
jgi:hypothetical protein